MKNLIVIIFTLTAFSISAQNVSAVNKQNKAKESKYINIETGFSLSSLRDFATSPLIYRGTTRYISLARNKKSDWREVEYGFKVYTGNYSVLFNEHAATSQTTSVSFYYSRLYKLNRWSNQKWNFKIGGMLFATGNLRGNVALQNNGRGLESFHSLLGSVKVTRDISRKETKHKKFLFFKYTLHPVRRELSFRFNTGLVNSYYRNGYIYANQSDITNSGNPLAGYQFHIFKGEIFSTGLEYTRYLSNNNAIKLSYKWSAYTTNEGNNNFEMAHHTLSLTFMFNTNKNNYE